MARRALDCIVCFSNYKMLNYTYASIIYIIKDSPVIRFSSIISDGVQTTKIHMWTLITHQISGKFISSFSITQTSQCFWSKLTNLFILGVFSLYAGGAWRLLAPFLWVTTRCVWREEVTALLGPATLGPRNLRERETDSQERTKW